MLELLGTLTLPLLAVATGFGVVVLSGEDITIDTIKVPEHLEWSGLSDEVVTRMLTDELRALNETASSQLRKVEVDGGNLDKSVTELGSFFDIQELIEGTRNLLGLIPYYINGEMTGTYEDLTLTVRIFFATEEDRTTHVVVEHGDKDTLNLMIHDAAVDIITEINPYVTVLYWRTREIDCYRSTPATTEQDCKGLDPALYQGAEFTFPMTLDAASHYFDSRPHDEHFAVYGLLGRMYMLKAESDQTLSDEGREAAYDEAIRYLDAALLQHPGFLFPSINLGMIAALRGDYVAADRYFADAVRSDPNDLTTRKAWATTLTRQGRFREAVFQWVAAVEIAPDDPALRASLAGTYDKLGMAAAAETQMKEAVRLLPTEQTYRDALAELTAG
jgi:tetratricopeptide (TPR) repeat protein